MNSHQGVGVVILSFALNRFLKTCQGLTKPTISVHLGEDQIADYAIRKGIPKAEVERWLSPVLGVQESGETIGR